MRGDFNCFNDSHIFGNYFEFVSEMEVVRSYDGKDILFYINIMMLGSVRKWLVHSVCIVSIKRCYLFKPWLLKIVYYNENNWNYITLKSTTSHNLQFPKISSFSMTFILAWPSQKRRDEMKPVPSSGIETAVDNNNDENYKSTYNLTTV